MATKRMFSKSVIMSDKFLDMPLTTQALYFHLGLHADDDGFVSPSSIMRMIGANKNDLDVLQAAGFIVYFQEDRVAVILHWLQNNTLKNDRYTPTVHTELKDLLNTLPNKEYEIRIQNGSRVDPQYSIVENSIVKNSIVENSNITKVIEAEPQQKRGREDINEVYEYFKEKLGTDLDRSVQYNRNQASNLLKKLKKNYPSHDPVDAVKRLIDISQLDSWHKTKATHFYYLYKHMNELIKIGTEKYKKASAPNFINLNDIK